LLKTGEIATKYKFWRRYLSREKFYLTVSRTRNYLLGLATGYTVRIVTIVVGLWLTPFVLRYLARDEYAIFALSSDVIMWLGLLDIGISAGLNVHLAQKSGKIDIELVSQYASTTFFAQMLIVLLVLLVGGGITLGFPSFFDVRPDLQQESMITVGLLVLGTAVSFGVRTFSVILVAHQQIHIDNLIRLGLIVIRTLLTVVLLQQGWGVVSLAVAYLAATGITSIFAVIRTYKLLPGIQIRPKLVSWDILKKVGGIGIWFSLGGLAGLVIIGVDRVVAGKLVSLEAVTVFSLTGRLYLLAQGFLDQIVNTARPALGQLIGAGKMDAALKTYRQMFTLSTGTAVVACFAIWAGNETFVKAWVGEINYGGDALNTAFALNLLVNVWIIPNRATLSAGLLVKRQVLSRVGEAVLNLGLSIFLTLQFGLVGVVLSTAIAALLTSFWYLPYLTAKMFERPYIRFLQDDSVKIIVSGGCLVPVSWIAQELAVMVGGLLGAVLGIGGTALIGLVVLWRVVFDCDLKKRIKDTVKRAFSKSIFQTSY
jgi:O-antigen/teichoic acid export membrane protein